MTVIRATPRLVTMASPFRGILLGPEAIRTQFPPKRIPSYSQEFRCLFAISAAAIKHPKNVSSLDLGKRKHFLIRRVHLRVGAQKLRGKIRLLDFRLALGQHDGALHGVLKLAHVAGPRIGEQPIQGCSREAARSAVVHRASTSHEAMSERQNVFAASPKRRYFDADHLQSLIEVLAKAPLANHFSEISICRGNNSYIHRSVVCPANAAYLVILKHAEKLHLY